MSRIKKICIKSLGGGGLEIRDTKYNFMYRENFKWYYFQVIHAKIVMCVKMCTFQCC